jgi:hypothetical protein
MSHSHLARGLLAALVIAASSIVASAQTFPGTSPQGRDCQTVRICNFARGAEVRGCLSSYTCRTCRMVRVANCNLGAGRLCHEMRCGWGG